MAWDDANRMSATYRRRYAEGLPLWAVFSYRDPTQYERKLSWYATRLREAVGSLDSVLDVGCGPGELLVRSDLPAGYFGVDVIGEFVDAARSRFPDRRFCRGDLLEQDFRPAHTVVMVGVLGLSPRPLELLERACALARTNVLFDFVGDVGCTADGYTLRTLDSAQVVGIAQAAGLQVVRWDALGSATAVWGHRPWNGKRGRQATEANCAKMRSD